MPTFQQVIPYGEFFFYSFLFQTQQHWEIYSLQDEFLMWTKLFNLSLNIEVQLREYCEKQFLLATTGHAEKHVPDVVSFWYAALLRTYNLFWLTRPKYCNTVALKIVQYKDV